MKNRVLVIEDDESIRAGLRDLLGERYDVALAQNGIEGIKAAIRETPDVILLDIMMPQFDGFQTCEALRKEQVMRDVPIIMLTALKDSGERIRAFEAGADDYISKPFDNAELVARMESKLRRFRELSTALPEQSGSPEIRCGNLVLDPESIGAWVDGKSVRLSLLEFKLVRHLVENRSKLCARDKIVEAVWGSQDVSGRLLDPHILSIRKKLKGFDHVIASVYGGGYVLKSMDEAS